jgi:plasmid stability protein
MASITIRNLEESLKGKLRIAAAHHGRSMEEEARHILRASLAGSPRAQKNLFDAIRRHIGPLGGVDLKLSPRGKLREPPVFEE